MIVRVLSLKNVRRCQITVSMAFVKTLRSVSVTTLRPRALAELAAGNVYMLPFVEEPGDTRLGRLGFMKPEDTGKAARLVISAGDPAEAKEAPAVVQ